MVYKGSNDLLQKCNEHGGKKTNYEVIFGDLVYGVLFILFILAIAHIFLGR